MLIINLELSPFQHVLECAFLTMQKATIWWNKLVTKNWMGLKKWNVKLLLQNFFWFVLRVIRLLRSSREYVVEHVLREAHKICIAMSVTLSIAAVQKSAEDALIGAELVQKMLWLVHFKIISYLTCVKKAIRQNFIRLWASINSNDDSFSMVLVYPR